MSETLYRLTGNYLNKWESHIWGGLAIFNGNDVWTDGTNIYYSHGTGQYILNKDTNTWEPVTWNGLTDFNGSNIWTDAAYTEDTDSFNGFTIIRYTWTEESNIYYGDRLKQYRLDRATGTWEPVILPEYAVSDNKVWTDGTNIYYSNGARQYRLVQQPIYEEVVLSAGMKVKDRGGIWYPVKGISVRTHGGSGSAGIASLPPTGAYISSYDPCLAFLGIDAMPKYIGTNYSDVDPWEDCSGEYIAEQKAYLSGSPYDGPNNLGDWYFLKVGDRVLAKSNSDSDSGFAPLIEFTEVPVTGMSLTVGGAAASPGIVTIPEGDSPAVQVTTGSDSTKQYYYCNSDWFNSISENSTDSIGSVYAGGNTLLIEIDPTNHTIGIAKYVYEAGN